MIYFWMALGFDMQPCIYSWIAPDYDRLGYFEFYSPGMYLKMVNGRRCR